MTGSCLQCGAPLGEGARFCSACGAPVAAPVPVVDPPAAPVTEHVAEVNEHDPEPPAAAWGAAVPDPEPVPAPQPPPGALEAPGPHPYAPAAASVDPDAGYEPVPGAGEDAERVAGQGRSRADALAELRGDPGPVAALWQGAWAPAVLSGLAPLAVLAVLALMAALGIAGDDAGAGLVWQYGAALVGAAFGGDVAVRASWERGGSLLDRLADDLAWSFRIEGLPLSLTVLGVVVLAALFAWRTRRLPAADLIGTALRTSLVLAAGVGLVTLLGRLGHASTGWTEGPGEGWIADDLRLDVHASTLGSTIGALLIALVTTGAVVLARRTAPEAVSRVRAALAAPAWVLALAFLALHGVGVAVLLVAAVLRDGAPSADEVTWALLALPAVTAWAVSVGLGPGVDVEASRLVGLPRPLAGGGAGETTRDVGVHLAAVADESALAWLIPPAVLVVILLTGLLLATRYDDARQARRGSLVAAGLAAVATAVWAGLSGLTIATPEDASLEVSVPALALGLWVGVLVAAAGFLATALLPRLPRGLLRVLAAVARR